MEKFASIVIVGLVNGITYGEMAMEPLRFYQHVVPAKGRISVGEILRFWEKRPDEPFEFNYQRDKWIDSRDEVIAYNYSSEWNALIRYKRGTKNITVYKQPLIDTQSLSEELKKLGYKTSIEDKYPDSIIDYGVNSPNNVTVANQ